MRKRITRISPVGLGVALAALFFVQTAFWLLQFAIPGGEDAQAAMGAAPAEVGIGVAVLALLFRTLGGFLVGVVGAAVYNAIAGLTGGVAVELQDPA